mgnify:CR=1 FL=1
MNFEGLTRHIRLSKFTVVVGLFTKLCTFGDYLNRNGLHSAGMGFRVSCHSVGIMLGTRELWVGWYLR